MSAEKKPLLGWTCEMTLARKDEIVRYSLPSNESQLFPIHLMHCEACALLVEGWCMNDLAEKLSQVLDQDDESDASICSLQLRPNEQN